ncbi:MAG: glycosyltransferase [Solirubrobacteraceae bacterium]
MGRRAGVSAVAALAGVCSACTAHHHSRALRSAAMRVLVVSNMQPDAAHPERGSFVRDQVRALTSLREIEVELFEFPPGARALPAAFAQLRARRARADVVHAHFSLSALPAFAASGTVRGLTLHGTDVHHRRTRQITRLLLPRIDVLVAVSSALASELPGARARRRAHVIPVGVSLDRFAPMPRAQARAQLGLPAEGVQLLFPADPARPEKRHDRALQLASALGTPLLSLGGVPPERVPLYVNAASAVLVTSEREGFGLAALEALACDVPVLATPVGVHPTALAGVERTLCAPFVLERWRAWLEALLQEPGEPRIEGRRRAEELSVARMAEELARVWRAALARRRGTAAGSAAASG